MLDLSVRRLRGGRAERSDTDDTIVVAQIATAAIAAERLLRAVDGGIADYIIVSADGRVSLRARLVIDSMPSAEERVGASRIAVDWSRSTLSNGKQRVALSRTELRLLGALIEGNGQAVSRERLIARGWPADRVAPTERENALTVYVCTLRKRLAAIGVGSALHTVRGVGYRLVL